MRRPFHCPHTDDKATLRKRLTSAGTVMVGYQCGDCGRIVGRWVKLERVPNWQNLPEWDHDLEPRWEMSERKRMTEYREWRVQQDGVAAFGRQQEQRPDNFWDKYSEYLRSPEWASKRALVFQRANGMCEGCGIREATQAHHLTYARVGREMLFDLVAICDACHEVVHGREL